VLLLKNLYGGDGANRNNLLGYFLKKNIKIFDFHKNFLPY